MSIAREAVRGAVWTIGLGVGSRAIGAVGTIIIARFIAPEVMGEVLAAWIVAILGHTLTRMGLDQYLIVKQDEGDDVPFHTTFWSFVFGVMGLGLVVLIGDHLGAYLNAPNMGQYVPGCVLAVAIRRVASIPDRVLVRDMHFRTVAVSQALGEITYVAATLVLVSKLGMGGHAVVIGNIFQAIVILLVVLAATSPAQWLEPCRITWKRTRDMLRFGVPLNFETALSVASRMGDNLMFSYRFGAGSMGLYNMAYNLADIPATHVGEHVSGVLLPSMSRIKHEHRIPVLIRSTAILAIVIFPMAVGLGVVAESLVTVLLPETWQGVAPLLTILAVLSVFRPVSWAAGAYLKVVARTGTMLAAEAFKVCLLLLGIAILPSPLSASVSIGIAFGAHAIAMVMIVARTEGVSPARFVPGFVGPLMACAVMACAVLGARHGLRMAGLDSALLSLLIEILVGAVVYVASALLLAPQTARDLLSLLRKAYSGDKPDHAAQSN